MSDRNYEQMTTEQLHQIVIDEPNNEDVFEVYSSRLDWKKPPKFNSAEEEEQFIKDLATQRTNN